ncbi:Pepco domain-containing protein [Trichothermofontia sp.]
MDDDVILVRTSADTTVRRGSDGLKELKVSELAENVQAFLNHIGVILEKAPEKVGEFSLTELSVSAEISTKGQLILLGSGVEAGAKGSLTFKFQRQG